MTWLQSASGARLDLLALRPESIAIGDVAHSLSQICRFTGSTSRAWAGALVQTNWDPMPYSVAEHCCHVHDAAPPSLRALALLHDAAEMVTGDLAGPFKALLHVRTPDGGSEPVSLYERRLLAVILGALGVSLTAREWADVMALDKRMLETERTQVYAHDMREQWEEVIKLAEPLPVRLQFWSHDQARREFLTRWDALKGA